MTSPAKHKSLKENIYDWFSRNPTAAIRCAPLASTLGASADRVADACCKLYSSGHLVRCRVIVPEAERGTAGRVAQFEYRMAAGTRATPTTKPYKAPPVFRRQPTKQSTTPAGGGANITGNSPSESRVAGGLEQADLPAEGRIVVEQPTPDRTPAEACSNRATGDSKTKYVVATNYQVFTDHQQAMAAAMRAANDAGRRATVFETGAATNISVTVEEVK